MIFEQIGDAIREKKKSERSQHIAPTLNYLSEFYGGRENILNSNILVEKLSQFSFNDYLDFLKKINAVVRGKDSNEVKILEESSEVTSMFGGDIYCPPGVEERGKIMEEAFQRVKELSVEPSDSNKVLIADTIYKSIVFLHPFADGNGRTARLLEYLISPIYSADYSRKKTPEKLEEQVVSLFDGNCVFGLPREHNIEILYFDKELRSRGMELIVMGDGYFLPQLRSKHKFGFDFNFLGFLAAYDVMTPEERKTYAIPVQVPNRKETNFEFDKLPKEIKKRIEEKMDTMRVDFARDAILNINKETTSI